MALILAICRPQPNWMPKNPKFMFQIWPKRSLGFSMLPLLVVNGCAVRCQPEFDAARRRADRRRVAQPVFQPDAVRDSRDSDRHLQRYRFIRAVEGHQHAVVVRRANEHIAREIAPEADQPSTSQWLQDGS